MAYLLVVTISPSPVIWLVPYRTAFLDSGKCSMTCVGKWKDGSEIRQDLLGGSLVRGSFSLPHCSISHFGDSSKLQMVQILLGLKYQGISSCANPWMAFLCFLVSHGNAKHRCKATMPLRAPTCKCFYLRESFIYFRLDSSLLCKWRWTWPSDPPASATLLLRLQ